MTGPSGQPEVEPDGVVRTALQLLPVPSHEDDFWQRLEAALDAEPPHVAPSEPVRRVLVADGHAVSSVPPVRAPEAVPALDPALAVVPAAFRRPSNVVLALVAAAAVVVVAIAGRSLVDERNGTTLSGPRADAELETLVRDAQAGGTVTTLSDRRQHQSSEAALDWVEDVGKGDADAAWKAMGTASQHHFASEAEFEDAMAELADQYGAWASAAPDDVMVMPVASGDDGTTAVVTLVGAGEAGSSPRRVEAIPIRLHDGDVVLEPFASAGDLEVVIPEPASDDGASWETVGTGEELVFVLPEGVTAPVLQIDDGDAVVCGEAPGSELGDLDQSEGQRCAYLPEGGFSAGAHTVTIAFLAPKGGAITAESIAFEAA